MFSPHFAARDNSAGARHIDVQENCLELLCLNLLESLLPIGGLGNLEAERVQSPPQHPAQIGVVVGNQDVPVESRHDK
jgi:hypothetical protein